MAKSVCKNTGMLSRFMLRRDRIRIPIWLFALAAITFVVALTFPDLYETAQDRQGIAETMKNPAMVAMLGKAYGIDDYTYGAIMVNQMLLFTMLAVAVMSILLVVRHTRADEEDGRIELIRSLPIGRLSNLCATVLVVCGANLVLALLVGFGLNVLQIDSMDLEGSLLYGAALGSVGIFFTAVTAVLVQLAESSRGVVGLAFGVLGISYLIRAVGDIGNGILSWFSPLGWVLGVQVYVNNYWWPIVVTIGASLILFGLAFYLNAIRDLEAGFIPAKPGRKNKSVFLQGPIGLSFRIQRTGIIAWAIVLYLFGASYGSIFGDLESFLEKTEMIQELINPVEGASLIDQFIPMLMSIMAMVATVPVLMVMLKLVSEERKNRTEHLLSRIVSRTRLMASTFILAVAIGFIMLSLAGFGLWSAGTLVVEDGLEFGRIYGAAMVYLPALWIMIGIAAVLIGIFPQFTGIIWAYLCYSFFVVYLGNLLKLPDWVVNLSPYGHIPQLPIEDIDYMKVSILTIIAAALTITGFIGYNKRDMT
jgi:ABC-2 type transport system permease protein